MIPDERLSLAAGAIAPWRGSQSPYYDQTLASLAKHYKAKLNVAWEELPEAFRAVVLEGSNGEEIAFTYKDEVRAYQVKRPFEGSFPSGWGYYPYAYRAALARRAYHVRPALAAAPAEEVELAPVPPDARCALVEVRVPAGAALWFDGEKTGQTGPARLFWSPPLELGKVCHYQVRARWSQEGRTVEQAQTVAVAAGTRARVVFPAAPEKEGGVQAGRGAHTPQNSSSPRAPRSALARNADNGNNRRDSRSPFDPSGRPDGAKAWPSRPGASSP